MVEMVRVKQLYIKQLTGGKLCKLLINNGADLNISTFKIRMGHSPLYIAIRNRHADVAELLITSGADVNIQYNDEETPLFSAAENGHESIVKLLIEKGADITVENKYGNRATDGDKDKLIFLRGEV